MVPEADVARLHRTVRLDLPRLASAILAEAGARTADYILSHRIPKAAQLVLKRLPAPVSAALLSRAIARNAWTFAGSGRFRAETPWCFAIDANPLVRGEHGDRPLCHWHAAVFERLYGTLVASDVTAVEVACCAERGVHTCRFDLRRPSTR